MGAVRWFLHSRSITLIAVTAFILWLIGVPLGNPAGIPWKKRAARLNIRRIAASPSICAPGLIRIPKIAYNHAFYPSLLKRFFHIPKETPPSATHRPRIVFVELGNPGTSAIQQALTIYDKAFRLPSASISVYQFTKNKPSCGHETALDLELAHAIAPYAKLIVVQSNIFETLNPSFIDYLSAFHPSVVSMSLSSAAGFWFAHLSMALLRLSLVWNPLNDAKFPIFVSSGDWGADITFPAGLPEVVAVGGTKLVGPPFSEYKQQGWRRSTGGYDTLAWPKPPWQVGDPTLWRGIPDISFVAEYYWESLRVGWFRTRGTSDATPVVAAVWVLGNQAHEARFGKPLPPTPNRILYSIWRHDPNAFIQPIGGSNGVHQVRPGWNAVTGIGVPNIPVLIRDLGSWRPQK